MSKFEKLNVDIRKEQGTSAARRTRLQNKVPAVVYHSGVEATPLSVDKISLNKIFLSFCYANIGKKQIFEDNTIFMIFLSHKNYSEK